VVQTHEVTPNDIIGGYKKFDNVPATVNGVLVLANTPDATSNYLNLTSVGAIENYSFSIESQATAGIANKTLMGKTYTFTQATNPDAPADTDIYKTADIVLDAITARFEIGDIVPGTGIKNIQIEAVWMNNFLTGISTVSPTLYDSGNAVWAITPVANTLGATSPLTVGGTIPAYSPSVYSELYDASVNGTDFVYAFQLFAGTYVPHLILLVSGQYDDDRYFLGWLTYNYFTDSSNQRITAVQKNMIYKVGLPVITVDAKDITTEPELNSFDLGVQCTITPWTEKNVTPGIE